MPEAVQPTPDAAGVTRTPTGEIANPNTSTPLSSPTPETIVRPQPTPTKDSAAEKTNETSPPKSDGKSLVNEKSPEGAPETYADFTAPEGFEIDKDVATEASALFKKNNLSQAAAQELVDFYIKKAQESHQQPYDQYVETRQTWRNEINSDPDIGGSKLNGVKASISKLIDSFGSTAEAFREAMDYTGAGDNPAVVKGLYALSKLLTEGGAVRGNGPSLDGQRPPGAPERPSAAQALYPNLPSASDRR